MNQANTCPIAELCDAMRAGGKPSLAWAFAMRAIDPDADPVATAWQRATDPRAMLRFVRGVCGRALAEGLRAELVRAELVGGWIYARGDRIPVATQPPRFRGHEDHRGRIVVTGVAYDDPPGWAEAACAVLRAALPRVPDLEATIASWGMPDVY